VVGKLLFSNSLLADVVSFNDPLDEKNINFKLFLANDPVSLEELFSGWRDTFDPKNGKNLALGDLRVDLGGEYNGIYFGYFYRYNVFIKTKKDFTKLYYNSKNKLPYQKDKLYDLSLEIAGFKGSGLMLSSKKRLYSSLTQTLDIGGAIFLLYGVDMQDGKIDGYATIPNQKEYNIIANSSYYYTHNYLYDLSVDDSKGYGYGSDLSLKYHNNIYKMDLKFIINDLFSYIHWKDLPYSFVHIKTENKSYDKDGFIKYSPSIWGVEKYKDYRQRLKPRYKFDITKAINTTLKLSLSLERVYDENLPYIEIDKKFYNNHDLKLSYESRFKSFAMEYIYKRFSFGLRMDKIYDFSTFGVYSGFKVGLF
jgi:hypothetical protein